MRPRLPSKLRQRAAGAIPRCEFFFQPPTSHPDSELWLAGAHRHPAYGPDMAGNYAIAQQISNQLRRVPHRRRARAAVLDCRRCNGHRSDPRYQVGMNARDVAQSVLVCSAAAFKRAQLLAESQERRQLPGRGAVSAYRVTSMQDLMNTPVNDPAPQRTGAGQSGALTPVSRRR